MVYRMSAGRTPARARGMPVPGINTRGAVGSHQSSPHGNHSSWPMTPPQSALELRRPSMAYSSVSDASSSGPPSTCDFSQPATPVQSTSHPHDSFTHSWNADATMTASMPEQCSLNQASRAMFNPALVHAMSGVGMTNFSPARHLSAETFGSHSQSPMRDSWSHASQSALHLNSGLRSTLFQTTHGMGHGNDSSIYHNPASSLHHASLEPSVFGDFNNVASLYHPAQVVIPSQVNSQEDYSMEQYPDYDANDRVSEELSPGFNSSATEFGGWGNVGAQSPEASYYTPSEEDEYILVKDEARRSPGSRQYYESPPRVNKRPSRRTRRSLPVPHVSAERDCHGIIVCMEGKPWVWDSEGHAVPTNSDQSKPPQRCTWIDGKGVKCKGKFSRTEHLKRHMTKHSDEKPYPCPLEGCEKAIKRPDNAGDHFRTHLRGVAKGKRNKPCTLEQLADAMRKDPSWDAKKTTKMLTNLEKWLPDWNMAQEEIKRTKVLEDEAKARAEDMIQKRHMYCRS